MPEGSTRFGGLLSMVARRRVALGVALGIAALWLARPTIENVMRGAVLAAIGEALRLWAAGHIEKGREVTTTGPYRWLRHPLYLGSAIMAIGLGVAASRPVVWGIVAGYLIGAVGAAVRLEDAWLRNRVDENRPGTRDSSDGRRFSLSRAFATNREYRAILGLALAILLLAWKARGRL
jgi:hypothetical protein